MTDEGKGKTEDWVASKKAKYPYAYDKGGKLSSWFGVSGIPKAFLIDPAGTVVWSGHPASLKKKDIEKHLAGAVKGPLEPWPDGSSKVRKLVEKEKFGKALAAAEKLGSEKVIADVKTMITGRVKGAETMFESKNYLGALELAEKSQKSLEGLPEADTLAEIVASIESDPMAKEVMAAHADVNKIMAGKIKKAKRDKILGKLRAIAGKYPDTGAGRAAEAGIKKLTKK